MNKLEQREGDQLIAPVPLPPVQLPPVLDSIFNLIMAVGAAQPEVAQAGQCQVGVAVTNSVSPSEGQVGDSVTFTISVTNDGNIPLTDVEIDSDLPSGLQFVSLSDGGSIDPDTGFDEWQLSDGLAVGATTTLLVTTTLSEPGTWSIDVCAAAQDAFGIEVEDCASASVLSGVATLTATTTPQLTATLGTTFTPTPTPARTMTPQPSATSGPTPTQTSTSTPQPMP